jgi:predicted metalloprotease
MCKLYGNLIKMRQLNKSKAEANKLSVALELQADFLWGWTHYNQKMNDILEDGDLDEALCSSRRR